MGGSYVIWAIRLAMDHGSTSLVQVLLSFVSTYYHETLGL